MNTPNKFGAPTALAVVIANMVGTGVFTSLGFQVVDIEPGFVIMVLWALGGIAALCGALCYAELGAALPRSGGEYNFLTRSLHPGAGFVAGWISTTIGFAAPIALASLAFAAYLTPENHDGTTLHERVMAAGLILTLAIIHSGRRRASGGAQNLFTAFKILVILTFSFVALWQVGEIQPINFSPSSDTFRTLDFGAFAVSLIYVGYAYTGWNAATYLTGELEDAQRQLPRVLIIGTVIVAALYLLLNAVFLLVTPIEDLKGVEEVGRVAAQSVFGQTGAQLAGFVFAALLVSTVSAMTVAGPRVLQVMGEDVHLFRALAKTNDDNIPYRAVWVQTLVALFYISLGTFEQVLVFSGFTLALVSLFTVIGAIVLRFTKPDLHRPFRIPLYPLPAIAFIAIIGWTLSFTLIEKPAETRLGFIMISSGAALYALLRVLDQRKT